MIRGAWAYVPSPDSRAYGLARSQESTGQDRVRADGSTNPLLKDGGLSTVVGKGDSNGALSTQLTRLQNRGANPDRCARPDIPCAPP